jgi:hypothetical protein
MLVAALGNSVVSDIVFFGANFMNPCFVIFVRDVGNPGSLRHYQCRSLVL